MEAVLSRICARIQDSPNAIAVSDFDHLSQRAITWTYADLGRLVAHTRERLPQGRPQPIGVFCQKAGEAYAAILSIMLAGNYFVPLNPKLPVARLRQICELAGIRTVLTDAKNREACGVLTDICPEIHLLARIESAAAAAAPPDLQINSCASSELAYVMFTSGSTGEPKGVMISRHNLESVMLEVFKFTTVTAQDRFSQIFELSFDLAIGEILWALSAGATLCPLDSLEASNLAHYLLRERISLFGCAPAFLQNLVQAGLLKNHAFPLIRFSLFCGEKLTGRLAREWAALAPHSTIENLYGPTEASLYVTRHTMDRADMPAPGLNALSIGAPFGANRVAIVGEDLSKKSVGEIGELWIGGPQVSRGYLNDPMKTAAAFVRAPWDQGSHERWYRTGDLAYFTKEGRLEFCGRMDLQTKILGQRIEISEIESVLNEVSPDGGWVVLAHPLDDYGSAQGTVAVTDREISKERASEILNFVKGRIARRLAPAQIFCVEQFPLTPHGKLDRSAILRLVNSGQTK